MAFPEAKRVKFFNNPLIEVVFRLDLSSSIRSVLFTDENMTKLHELLKTKFQQFKKSKNIEVSVDTQNDSIKQSSKVVYEFESLDGTLKALLADKSLTVVNVDYQSRESFLELISFIVEQVKKLGLHSMESNRVGLRYKDIIHRSALNGIDQKTDWSELLNPKLLSMVKIEGLTGQVLGINSSLVIAVDDDSFNTRMNVSYGTVTHAKDREECFLIDSDFYAEGVFDYDVTKQFFSNASAKSQNFFQWCLERKLYDALDPREI